MADGQGSLTNFLTWIFTGATTIFVALRIFSRLKLKKVAGWDDLVISISLLIILLLSALTSYAVAQGLGTHLHTLTPSQGINAAKWVVVVDTLCIFSFTVPKLGVAILLHRVLTVGKPLMTHRLSLFAPAVFMITFSCAAFGVWLGQCRPLEGLWNKTIEAECMDTQVYLGIGMAVNCTSAATDFFYGIYPIAFIQKLNMDTRRKIHLSIMFGLSAVGGAVAIWKTTKFPAISQPDADVTYVSAAPIYATIIEADVIIIAACIPTISPVTRMLRGKADALGSKLRDMSFSSYHQFDAGGAGAKSSTQAYASGNPTSDHTFQSHELPQLENGKAVLPNRERQTARMPEVEVLAETVVDVQRSPL